MKDHIKALIEEHIASGKSFIDLRKPMEEQGYRVKFAFEPVPYFTISSPAGEPLESYMVLNKKYADVEPKDIVIDNLILSQTI